MATATAHTLKVGVNCEIIEREGKVWVGFDPGARHGQSASGKTIRVATTEGNVTVPTSKGNVTVGFNVYVKP